MPAVSSARMVSAPFRRFIAALAGGAMALILAGCLDIEQQIAIQSDGSVVIDIDQLYDEDMKDIAAFLDAVGRQGPQASELRDGVCGAIQTAAMKNPVPDVKVTAKEFVFSGKYVCQNQLTLASIAKLETKELPINNILQVKPVGERKLMLALNLSEIPDFAEDAQRAMSTGLASVAPPPPGGNPYAGTGADPSATGPAGPDARELWRKSHAATVAATRLLAKNRYFQLTIKAPRIVESNGKIDDERTKVQFRFTWTEIVELMYDPAKRKDKNLFVILEY